MPLPYGDRPLRERLRPDGITEVLDRDGRVVAEWRPMVAHLGPLSGEDRAQLRAMGIDPR